MSISLFICNLTLKIPNEFKGTWAENDFFFFYSDWTVTVFYTGLVLFGFFPKYIPYQVFITIPELLSINEQIIIFPLCYSE